MSNKAKQKAQAQREYKELKLKKRQGLIKIAITIVLFIVFIVARLYVNATGIIDQSNMWFNLITLCIAFLACFFAGTGSNDIAKANRRMKEIDAGQYKAKKGPSEKW